MEPPEYEIVIKETERLKTAEMFARGVHIGQKHGDLPYWMHLQHVAHVIKSWSLPGTPQLPQIDNITSGAFRAAYRVKGKTIHLMCGAWLHHSIESTAATYRDIRELFGEKIADLVQAVTDGKWQHVKKEKCSFTTACATLLKLADFYSNAQENVERPPIKDWAKYYSIFKRAIARHRLEDDVGHILENLNSWILNNSSGGSSGTAGV